MKTIFAAPNELFLFRQMAFQRKLAVQSYLYKLIPSYVVNIHRRMDLSIDCLILLNKPWEHFWEQRGLKDSKIHKILSLMSPYRVCVTFQNSWGL